MILFTQITLVESGCGVPTFRDYLFKDARRSILRPDDDYRSRGEMTDTQAAAARRSRPGRGKALQIAISVVVVGAIFFFALPQIADLSSVWDEISAMTLIELTSLFVVAAWNIVSYWFVAVAALPGSNLWQAMKVNGASTAIANTIPGGGALGIGVTYGMYISYGFSQASVARAVLVTGIWNNFVKLGMPIVALVLLALHGGATRATLVASIVGLAALATAIVLFGLILYRESFAQRIGSWIGKVRDATLRRFHREPGRDLAEATTRFRRDTIDLLSKRWVPLTLATLISHISLFIVLLMSLRHVGVSNAEVPWQEVLATFAFVRLITALPITPGGLGVVELGYSAALVTAGGGRAEVVAGILVFRAFTYVLPIPWGIAMYLRWRQGAERRRLRVAAAKESPEVAATSGDRGLS